MDSSGAQRLKKQSKLLGLSTFEQRDELEDKLENGFVLVQSRTNGLAEKDAYDVLLQMASDQKVFEQITGGLLYGLLTEPHNAHKYFSEIAMLARDNWFFALCSVNMVLIELYPKMRPEVRDQVTFFFREAIQSNVPKIDNVLINFLRNSNDGSELKDVCTLLSAVANLLIDNRAWLSGLKPKASLIPVTFLTFTRFICDLSGLPQYDLLRQQLVTVSHWLITERFNDCAQLGRDLVLGLLRVSKVPQFASIWKQLLHTPFKLASNLTVEELMGRPCPPTFPVFRVSVAMQRKMEFMFVKIKPGTHERHLDWFKKQYLSFNEAGNLRAELIRTAIFMSSSETLQFGQEMKAIFISSIFSSTSNLSEQQICKLHLFWDWFCYDPAAGGHALLGMMSSELYPPLQNRIVNSVISTFKFLVDHNIIGSMSTIFDNPVLQKNVRDTFRETFKGLLRQNQLPPSSASSVMGGFQTKRVPGHILPNVNAKTPRPMEKLELPTSESETQQPSTVSECSLPILDGNELMVVADDDSSDGTCESSCVEKVITLLAAVKEEFRDSIENLANVKSTDNDARCEMMQKLLANIFDNDELLDEEQIELISECLLLIFDKSIRNRKPFPENFAEALEVLEEIFNHPLYVIYRNLCLTPEGDATREPLLSLISEMCEKCTSLSYLLLFFVSSKRRDQNDTAVTAYTDLCRLLDCSVIQQIVNDLELCHIDDHNLFAYLVPYVYEKFANEAMGSVELMSLLTHSLDAHQVSDLIGEVIRENISLFRKDSFLSIVNASLSWETTAQFIFWQLVLAEGVPIDWLLQVIPRLQYPKHAEAITHIYIMLQRMDREPNMVLIRNLLSRPPSDMFTVNCLKILIRESDNASRVAELLANLIDKLIQSGDLLPIHSKGKRPNQRYVCLDQLFAHLDKFRQSCLSKDSHAAEMFLARPTLQEAFTSARAAEKVSALRIRFSELFAVMEILSDDSAQNARSLRRSKPMKKLTDISDDEGKTKRKRQKMIVDSDSD